MQPEIEVKFFKVDHDKIRAQLTEIGAVCEKPMRAMKRSVMDYPDRRMQAGNDDNWSWIRVRDEGDRTTLTFKQIAKNEAFTTHEIEEEVQSYEQTVAIFEAIGLKKHAEQETRRETWRLGECEIMLDAWPWLPLIVELEGPDESTLQPIASKLGFKWDDAIRANADEMYRMTYPGMAADESVSQIPSLGFDVMPEWLEERKK